METAPFTDESEESKPSSSAGRIQGSHRTGTQTFPGEGRTVSGNKSVDLKSVWRRLSKEKEYLRSVKEQVEKDKGRRVTLKNHSGPDVNLKIAAVDDTVYSETPRVVDGWGKFYLPQVVEVCVFGVEEDDPCSSCDQFVLMTCGDQRIFAYDGEELHKVAADLNELFDKGVEYPASESYYKGEAFKDMTDDDWEEVKKGPVGQRLDDKHRELVLAHKDRFLALLS